MRLFFVLISLLFFAQIIHAQSISGQITDKETGEGLPFTNVILLKDGIQKVGTITNLDGNYTFTNIKSDTYDIEAVDVGFKNQRITGVNVKEGTEIEVNVEMVLDEGYRNDFMLVDPPRRYFPPLVDVQNTSTGQTLTSSDIKRRF